MIYKQVTCLMKYTLVVIAILLYACVEAQVVRGTVTTTNNEPISKASVQEITTNTGTVTNRQGQFELSIAGIKLPIELKLSHVSFQDKYIIISDLSINHEVKLQEKTSLLNEIEVLDSKTPEPEVSAVKLDPKGIEVLPTPFQEFNKILATLPGVVSNNELSSAYSVRGGNFDENLVYVNDIPIYRPFLVTNGQQEGLSFINSNLVSGVTFSAGGWQAKYGDKLSSVLNVTYKDPTEFAASATLGLLGGAVHVEGVASQNRISYAAGIRHKSSQYLLNTLEVEGQYLPRFTDYQSIINFNLGPADNPERTQLSLLTSYARNRFFVEPASRETEFGNFNQSLRLFVAFDGQETLEYDTYQIGTKLKHKINNKWRTQLVAAAVYASEREYTEVEGGYRLCDVDKNLSSSTFNDCVFIRGIGTNYDYGRNNLTAEIINVENRHVVLAGKNTIEFGLSYSKQLIEDQLQEYSFTDSAGFVTQIDGVQSETDLNSDQIAGFAQATIPISQQLSTTVGARVNYWNLNNQWLFSPRVQFVYTPVNNKNLTLLGAIGVYQQPPFFREMRAFDGSVNTNLRAQRSVHFIGGLNYNFIWWGRPFVLNSEIYYKHMTDIVPYEVENVKVRYYAENNAEAFATGFDVRISGEFIEGAESWFSLGLLNVKENVTGDGNGYIRRPTDQRINAAIFFQDHIPNNPNIRVNLNLLYGSGLPFGPPQDFENRNSFNGGAYTRVDIGFSKVFYFNREKYQQKRSLTISAEILNLLGTDNPISYTWISDVNNDQFAVPNSLSARFFNIRATIRI